MNNFRSWNKIGMIASIVKAFTQLHIFKIHKDVFAKHPYLFKQFFPNK